MVRSASWQGGCIWLALIVGGVFGLELSTTAIRAAENDASGGWTTGDIGFASKAPVPQDAIVEIRVIAMGNSRGIVVTFSGNRDIYRPGKLWNRQELREGTVVKYSVPEELGNRQLAVRSGAATVNFDMPVNVEVIDGSYRMHFSGGRILQVSTRHPKQGNN
jgi:hypothetical protein